MKIPLAYLALPLTLIGGCFGTETGNPPLTAELTVDAHSSDPMRIAIDVDASEAVVQEAWVVLGDVQFVGDVACEEPTELMSELVRIAPADHAGVGHQSATFETREREFCRVDVGLEAGSAPLPAGAPADLDGASIVLLGRSAADVPFTLVHRAPAQLTVRGDFALDADRLGYFLGFDVAAWLEGIDLATATRDPGGRIRIDDAQNTALHDRFEANLAAGVELYRDDDVNGEPDEATPLARGEL